MAYLYVAMGGAFGAMARFFVVSFMTRALGGGFPYGTLVVNTAGSFVLVFLMTMISERAVVDPQFRWLVVVGFLGSFTTFSSFTYETYYLFAHEEYIKGLLNVVLNNLLAFAGGVLGLLLARTMIQGA